MTFKPREYQTRSMEAMRDCIREGKRKLILCAPTGSGKCHGKGTPIIMADGSIKMVEDIEVGDRLLGPDGTARNVLSLGRGRADMHVVIPIKGDPFSCNGDHILSLQKLRVKHGMNLADGQHIAIDDDYCEISLNDYIASNRTARHCLKLWRPDGVEFPDAQSGDMPIPPYILGAWLGDGSARLAAVSKPECRMTREWCDWVRSLGVHIRKDNSNGTRCDTWHATTTNKGSNDNHALNLLRSLNLIHNKHIPNQYKTASRTDRLELIAGMLDTDGHHAKGGYDWVCKCEQMATDFTFICRSVGLMANLRKCRKGIKSISFSADYWRVHVSGNTTAIPCRDKPADSRRQKKNPLRTGFTVQDDGEGDYYGFTLDGDGLYLLGDFTVTHNTVCASILMSNAKEKGKRSIFIAPRRELIGQCGEKLEENGIQYDVLMAGEATYGGRDIWLASADTLYARAFKRSKITPPEADLVIVDEAHLWTAPTRLRIIEYYANRGATIIGLSATPARKSGKGLGDFFQAIVPSAGYEELISLGALVPALIYEAPNTPDMKGIKKTGGDFNEGQTAERMDKKELIGDAVQTWQKYAEGRKTLAYCTNIAHSLHVKEQFERAGIPAMHVDGTMSVEDRTHIIETFKTSDQWQVLSSCDILTYGFDCPAVECLSILRPTSSLVLWRQIAGRGLRAHPGKSHVILLDHAGNTDRLGPPDIDLDWPLEKTADIQAKNKAKIAKEELQYAKCKSCGFQFRNSRKCPMCGSEILVNRKPKAVKVKPGELKLRKRRENAKAATEIDYLRSWRDCVGKCVGMNRKGRRATLGTAAMMFRDQYGKLPFKMPSLKPYIPGPGSGKWGEIKAIDWYANGGGEKLARLNHRLKEMQ